MSNEHKPRVWSLHQKVVYRNSPTKRYEVADMWTREVCGLHKSRYVQMLYIKNVEGGNGFSVHEDEVIDAEIFDRIAAEVAGPPPRQLSALDLEEAAYAERRDANLRAVFGYSTAPEPKAPAALSDEKKERLSIMGWPAGTNSIGAGEAHLSSNFVVRLREKVEAAAKARRDDPDNRKLRKHGAIALDPETAPETLRELAHGSTSELIRSYVAVHANTPTPVLVAMAGDSQALVRSGVAMNSKTPVETLVRLSTDKESSVRLCVATNKNTPADVVARLTTTDAVPHVRRAAHGAWVALKSEARVYRNPPVIDREDDLRVVREAEEAAFRVVGDDSKNAFANNPVYRNDNA